MDIARLRFWLSLIVDEEKPKALPNLDYKIVVGNSLVSKLGDDIIDIDWNVDTTKSGAFAQKYLEESKVVLTQISKEQKEFFNPESDKKKLAEDIRKLKIDLLISQLEMMVNTKGIEKQPVGTGKTTAKQTEIYLQTMGWKNSIKDLQKLKNKPEAPLHFFDWKLDFPEVMNEQVTTNVGFDIVIGNPPYGAKFPQEDKIFFRNRFKSAITISGVQKGSFDTYSLFIEKGFQLLISKGFLMKIVPISVCSGDSMTALHNFLLVNCGVIKFSSYSDRPQQIFSSAAQAVSIFSFKKDFTVNKYIYSTKMYRKDATTSIKEIVDNLRFTNSKGFELVGRFAKISLDIEKAILNKIFKSSSSIGKLLKSKGVKIYYRMAGGRYYKVITDYPANLSSEKHLVFDKKIAKCLGAFLSSNLLWWYNQVYTSYPNWKAYEIESFPIPLDALDNEKIEQLEKIFSEYLKDIEKNANVRETEKYANIDSFKEYKIGRSKHLIDKIDDIIGPLYGLTKDEIHFIKKYEINYRLQEE
ncbi:MAG: Eco57I restriction-modification methylase domain-containing protein [Bacteroidetes bacterium]|nr:Eco57I restriction-modification methylase domain-containing protein [Bacteroidota bacterium]